ncbi:right-handed parallel beta-helix repeat-containing protein [Jannaschia sp. LMIT008]|uniref:right-handed parallel beta-helix repeat-containing protein n=1 Tax=Jannaschia maritima TaxID=3032585 RepID=UPI0028111B5B|nr:right-handed parallel beta-helix repeat-containing protein [Jannaschia sp. LMIT008]
MQYSRVIENLVLNETLLLEGPAWNDTLIRNVTIENVDGNGIMLRDVQNVTIDGVTVRNISGDGIKLSSMGSTEGVRITNSVISRTGQDGINVSQRTSVDHPGLEIVGNTIEQTGLSGGGSGLMHGIYVQSTDFVIAHNLILASTDGNGISARSSGQIRDNAIDGAFKSGIAYFADHPAGEQDRLVIAGNVIRDAGQGTDRGAIDILRVPNIGNVVSDIVIEENLVAPMEGGAIRIAPGYGHADATVAQRGNAVADPDQILALLEGGEYGGAGSAADAGSPSDPRPGAGLFPDLEAPGNMRLTLSEDGLGQTDVLLSHGDYHKEAFSVDPETTLRRATIDEMAIRISAASEDGAAQLGVDAGGLSVSSPRAAFDGGIAGGDVLIVEIGQGPVGDVQQLLVGLQGASTGDRARIELLHDGRTIATYERPADEVIDMELDRPFNQARISAADGASFSLAWIEFGGAEPGAAPVGEASHDDFVFAPPASRESPDHHDAWIDHVRHVLRGGDARTDGDDATGRLGIEDYLALLDALDVFDVF